MPRILVLSCAFILSGTLFGCAGDGGESDACGNGICEVSETEASCPSDCSLVGCGDGTCDDSEDMDTCAEDCSAAGPLDGRVWARCELDYPDPLVSCAGPISPDLMAIDGREALLYDSGSGGCERRSVVPNPSALVIAECGPGLSGIDYEDWVSTPSFTGGFLTLSDTASAGTLSQAVHYAEMVGQSPADIEALCVSTTDRTCPTFDAYAAPDARLLGEWQYCVGSSSADPVVTCADRTVFWYRFEVDGTIFELDLTTPGFTYCYTHYYAGEVGAPDAFSTFGSCAPLGRQFALASESWFTEGAETYLTWSTGGGGHTHMVKVPDGTQIACPGHAIVHDETCN